MNTQSPDLASWSSSILRDVLDAQRQSEHLLDTLKTTSVSVKQWYDQIMKASQIFSNKTAFQVTRDSQDPAPKIHNLSTFGAQLMTETAKLQIELFRKLAADLEAGKETREASLRTINAALDTGAGPATRYNCLKSNKEKVDKILEKLESDYDVAMDCVRIQGALQNGSEETKNTAYTLAKEYVKANLSERYGPDRLKREIEERLHKFQQF